MPYASSPRASTFLGALALDMLLGDPPTVVHPVGWIGRVVGLLEACAPASGGLRRRYGMAAATALPLLVAGVALACERAASRLGAASSMAESAALDTTFALHTLLRRADEVRRALDVGDLDEARTLLRRHLVSRDVSDLTASEVAGAAIESVAENLGDGVVAPWLAYTALGLPGAFAYRTINTLDSMWGYRTERYAELGFAAAKIDDAANWVPARVTALAIIAAAALGGGDARGAFEVWRRDATQTESPNAGHPMSAMAGALGIVLTKRGLYILGGDGREPDAGDIARAIRVARLAAFLSAVLVTGVLSRSSRSS